MEDKPHGADGEAVHVPIDGVLDLHSFSPRDLKYLIPDYLDECLKKGIFHVRIIHGKGTGNLRRTVHALLERHPDVISYKLGDESSGSWGATLVTLQAAKHPPA
ncbi:Smr/MutS family protein [Desulfogranum japonicum]|uniref:Smr/MutS family protein n=1 Tax=Desulfogranum japonicum TaxID=231447 RepID=UPI0003F9C260|nr:Smr/MutS family protein [Desulfogranum japonicum]